MDRDLAARLVSTCGSVWNMYGPTETTIWSSVARIESDEVTIGRPIANTRMYVLDGQPGTSASRSGRRVVDWRRGRRPRVSQPAGVD